MKISHLYFYNKLQKINENYAKVITLRGLIFAWINFRDFANYWTFREN